MERSNKTLTIAFISVLAVLCLIIQISPRPPNVEFTSLFTFTIGFIFGSIVGGLFGSFVMLINGFLSPWGLAGGVYRKFAYEQRPVEFCVEAAILGGFLTALYDLITNFGFAVFQALIGVPFNIALITALAYGTFFSIIHVVSNTAVFGVAFLPITKAVYKVLVVNKIG
jgi:hypothetical protein